MIAGEISIMPLWVLIASQVSSGLKSRMCSVGLTNKSEKVNEARWEISLKVSQIEDHNRWTESYRDMVGGIRLCERSNPAGSLIYNNHRLAVNYSQIIKIEGQKLKILLFF